MKIDELLKRLENVEIDEDEKREIAEYIAQKLGVDNSIRYYHYIITKDRKIYNTSSYKELLKSNEISPNDAYVYVENDYFTGYDPIRYFYPFLIDRYFLPHAYLSKLGLESKFYRIAPATELRYVSMVVRFLNAKRAVVEVANIDDVAINTNLPRMVRDISTKQIDDDVAEIIASQLVSQKLFAGHEYYKALVILYKYYENRDTSLAKDVAAIIHAYNQIFRPYRTEYDLKSKQIIASFERKLF